MVYLLVRVVSMKGAYSGLQTQGRKRSFMAPMAKYDRPDSRRRRGRQAD